MDSIGGQKWSCEYCTYENWPASKKCVLCHAPKPPQFIDDDAPLLEQDIYKMAPLVYPEAVGPVESSGHSSDQSSPNTSLGSVGQKWTCQTCTYLNWPKAGKCTQCMSARPHSTVLSPTRPLAVDVNIAESAATGSILSRKNSPSSPEAAKVMNNDKNRAMAASAKATAAASSKWSCKSCTYENWLRSVKCILCGAVRPRNQTDVVAATGGGDKERSPNSSSENELNRSFVTSSSSKRISSPSFVGSTHNLAESIDHVHIGGATASPSIYQQQQQLNLDRHHHPTTQDATSNMRKGGKNDDRKLRQVCNRLRDINWQWLNACRGIIDGDANSAEAYLASGGDPTRQLTADECECLNRPSAFKVGYTLIHLAIRFQREDILAALLATTDAVSKARKRVPSYMAPDIATCIMRDVSASIRQRKGDFPCYFITDISTFALPNEIEDLPNAVKKQLFDELLDKNVQKELEDDEPVINWSSEITERLGSRLYPLWNRTAGDCLLDSVLQASWGVMDRDNTLRRALADSLGEGAMMFYRRWKETESIQAELLNFSLEESQWEHDWAILLSLASQPGASLEQVHIFALSHILRRPIIVYGIKFVKSYHGDNIGLARFQGVYLPFLWEQSFCWRTPIALGYTRGHFSALVPMEVDVYANVGAQANIGNNEDEDDVSVAYLPLMDYEGKILPIHFLPPSEFGHEQSLLHEWLECCVTDGGLLVAKQRLAKPPHLVRQMADEWLHRYRSLAQMVQSASVATSSAGHIGDQPSPTGALSSDEDTDDE